MKKRLTKIFRENAAELVPISAVAVRHNRVEKTDVVTGEKKIVVQKNYVGVAVNHARRLRKAYQSGGEAAMTAYLKKVKRATEQNNLMLR